MRLKSPTQTPISFGTNSGSGHCMVLGPDGDEVPQMFVQSAFAAGAVPDGADPAAFVASPAGTNEKNRDELIIDGIKAMLERSEDGDFLGSGLPDRRKLAKVVGMNVTAEEVAVAWKSLSESV